MGPSSVKWGNYSTSFTYLLQRLDELMCVKHLEQCLADSKVSMHVTIMLTVTF